MKIKDFLTLSFCSIITTISAQKSIFTEAKLKSVMLYEQCVELASNSSFRIPKGGSEIAIANTAENIDKSSNENRFKIESLFSLRSDLRMTKIFI